MAKIQNDKKFDLEERSLNFAKRCRDFVKNLPKTIPNFEYGKQLIRSSGSIGANYIEANEALGRKDFFMRIRISRKEAKESRYWLLLIEPEDDFIEEKGYLIKEATEFIKIFSSMLNKEK